MKGMDRAMKERIEGTGGRTGVREVLDERGSGVVLCQEWDGI